MRSTVWLQNDTSLRFDVERVADGGRERHWGTVGSDVVSPRERRELLWFDAREQRQPGRWSFLTRLRTRLGEILLKQVLSEQRILAYLNDCCHHAGSPHTVVTICELGGTVVEAAIRYMPTPGSSVLEYVLHERGEWPTSDGRDISVLAYNVWMVPTAKAKRKRARMIGSLVSGPDVIVISEAYRKRHRRLLGRSLGNDHYERTSVVGHTYASNGGVFIAYRGDRLDNPDHDEIVFKSGSAPDNWASKGAKYVELRIRGRVLHIIGTHLQAGKRHARVRRAQLGELKRFIGSKRIPPDEPVIIAGDLNVRWGSSEHRRTFELLNAMPVVTPGDGGYFTTADGKRNDIMRYDGRDADEWLDYVLVLSNHAHPLAFRGEVRPIKSRVPWRYGPRRPPQRAALDLSDHDAVLAVFRF